MKVLIILLVLIFSSTSFSAKQHYIRDSRGRLVPVITPRQLIRKEAQKEKQIDGVGQPFYVQAKVESGKITTWIRGCNEVTLGDLEKEEDPEKIKSLKEIKNGDRLVVKMQRAGGCDVADFRK